MNKKDLKSPRFMEFVVTADGSGEVYWSCPYCHDFWSFSAATDISKMKLCPSCSQKFKKWNKEVRVKLSAEVIKIDGNVKTWCCPHDGCKAVWTGYTTMKVCPECKGALSNCQKRK